MCGSHWAQEVQGYMGDGDSVNRVKDRIGTSHSQIQEHLVHCRRAKDMESNTHRHQLVTPNEACTRVCQFGP